MNDKDTRSLKVVKVWKAGAYSTESESTAALQVLINAAFEERELLIRMTCAEAVILEYGKRAADLCLGVKAV